MELTLEKLMRLRENSLGLGLSTVLKSEGAKKDTWNVHYEIIKINDNTYGVYIGDIVNIVIPQLVTEDSVGREVFYSPVRSCDTVYIFGGKHIRVISYLKKFLHRLRIEAKHVDLSFITSEVVRDLSYMFTDSTYKVTGLDKLLNNNRFTLKMLNNMFYNSKIDRVSFENLSLQQVQTIENMFMCCEINYLDASFLKYLNSKCNYEFCFSLSTIGQLVLPDLLDKHKGDNMFDNGTSIELLRASEDMYDNIIKSDATVGRFIKSYI